MRSLLPLSSAHNPRAMPWFEHLAVIAFLIGGHAALLMAFESATPHAVSRVRSAVASMTVSFLRSTLPEAGEAVSVVDPRSLRLRLDHPRLMAPLAALSDFDSSMGPSPAVAAVIAPSLIGDGHSGIEPYVQRSGLRPGEGAMVVLRIRVSESGDAGRIEVDSSSGRRNVDQAAVDFARVQHWSAARVNGVLRSMWINWGVRLQAPRDGFCDALMTSERQPRCDSP